MLICTYSARWLILASVHRYVEDVTVFTLEQENEQFILKGPFLLFPCMFNHVNGFLMLKLHYFSGLSMLSFF